MLIGAPRPTYFKSRKLTKFHASEIKTEIAIWAQKRGNIVLFASGLKLSIPQCSIHTSTATYSVKHYSEIIRFLFCKQITPNVLFWNFLNAVHFVLNVCRVSARQHFANPTGIAAEVISYFGRLSWNGRKDTFDHEPNIIFSFRQNFAGNSQSRAPLDMKFLCGFPEKKAQTAGSLLLLRARSSLFFSRHFCNWFAHA